MRVYLLNPPFTYRFNRTARWQARGISGALYYPYWLSYAAGVLEREHKVRLVDAIARNLSKEDVLKDVRSFEPDLAVVECNFSTLSNDIKIAEMIKGGAKDVKIILVGPPCSQFPKRILENSAVDFVARFEYDFTLRDIAEAIESGKSFKKIKGISYKEDGELIHNPNREFISSKELDNFPFVSRIYKKYLNIKDYFLAHTLYPEVQIFTGRGCPNRCTFCSWPKTLMGRRYRVRSIENVVDELEYIKKELPEVKEVFIEDDTFTANKERVKEFCEEIKRRKLDIVWSCNARANLDYETMKIMKEAGCRLLDVGYESGDDKILKNIKKGITTEEMREFTKNAKKAKLMIHADFIIGLPGETKETVEKTIKFVKELKPDTMQFSVIQPIPGTEFYEWANKNGFLLVDDLEKSIDVNGYQRCIVSYPNFTHRDIERYTKKGVREYYLSLSYLPIAIRKVLRKNGLHELKGMLRCAKVFLGCIMR